MSELLDIPYNLRGNKDEAVIDAMREIESLCQTIETQDAEYGRLIGIEKKRGDEWHRRALDLYESFSQPGKPYTDDVKAWFAEE